MKSLIPPYEATRLIRESLPAIPAIQCPLNKCAGRILRETIVADRPFPPFNRSMMDGYAIRANEIDESGIFHIRTLAPAGSPARLVGTDSKSCAEIMTGAVVPDDTDCVVPYEATKRIDEKTMQLSTPSEHATGDCIHPFASDRAAGEVLLNPGTRIGSREIAVAATCGYNELSVAEMPSIAIISTGDELVDVGAQPEPHQIRRSNDRMIETAMACAHLYAQERAHLPDDYDQCKQQLQELISKNNILLLSGGVSMGKKDYIPEVLEALGLTNHFHGVTQKPGKPMGFWTNAGCAVFTLPGNPLSTLTCLHHYVIPSIFDAMGQSPTELTRTVRIDNTMGARDDFTLFVPVKLDNDNSATSHPTQNSGDLVRILNSDGYIIVPPNKDRSYSAGTAFSFYHWY